MKSFFRRIHLYLSLAAGIVILIACITGAILVFEKDLQMAANKERYYVSSRGDRLPLELLADSVRKAFPSNTVSSVKVYDDLSRSAEFGITAVTKRDSTIKSGAVGA